MNRKLIIITFLLFNTCISYSQNAKYLFRIRTITAGVNLKSLTDTTTLNTTIDFLQKAKQEYIAKGYEVQTLRISTQNLYYYLKQYSYNEALLFLENFDKIAKRNNIVLSIGQLNSYEVQQPLVSVFLYHPTKKEFILIQLKLLQKLFQLFQEKMAEKPISGLRHLPIVRQVFLFFLLLFIKEKIVLLWALNQLIL